MDVADDISSALIERGWLRNHDCDYIFSEFNPLRYSVAFTACEETRSLLLQNYHSQRDLARRVPRYVVARCGIGYFFIRLFAQQGADPCMLL